MARKLLATVASLLLAVCAVAVASHAIPSLFTERLASVNRPPNLMFWCWEKHRDMLGLPPATGVAVLACTITVADNRIRAVPRMQALAIDEKTFQLPTVRLETRNSSSAFLSSHAEQIADLIVKMAARLHPGMVQIDYDARQSERAFYRTLLKNVRSRLPPGSFLSMTALPSWLVGDCWLREGAVDECVPMFFSMGPHGEELLKTVESRGAFAPINANIAIGLSSDEMTSAKRVAALGLVKRRRVYLFSTRQWSQTKRAESASEVKAWQ